jgi:hypothetical protein
MAGYDKKTWIPGEIIKSDDINNIESGIETLFNISIVSLIAQEFEPETHFYHSGDYVIKDDKLFKIKSDGFIDSWTDETADELSVIEAITFEKNLLELEI